MESDPRERVAPTSLACDPVPFGNQTRHGPKVIIGIFAASLLIAAVPPSVLILNRGPEFRREIVDVNTYPWSSIGKIGNSEGGQCTGAMIGPNQFLTTAYCLYNYRTGRFISADSIHFLLGYVRGQYRVHRIASRYTVLPTFDPTKKAELGTAHNDWAILYVNDPFPTDIRPLRLASVTPRPGRAVKTAGYNQERLQMLTADLHCRIELISMDGKLIAHDCVTQPGDSGAPLLSGDGSEEGLIVGVNLGGFEYLEQSGYLSVAVSAASITEFLASQVVGSIDRRKMSKVSNVLF
jgi:protease YdgD